MRWASLWTLGALFQTPTLLSFALQSFSPPGWSRCPREPLFPLLLVSSETIRPHCPVLQWLPPTQKAVPLVAPERLTRVGTVALLSFMTSQALSLPNPPTEASTLRRSPLVLGSPSSCEPCFPTPQGLPGPAAWRFPLRAPACLAFSISNPLQPLQVLTGIRTIFSSPAATPLYSGLSRRLCIPATPS